MRKMRKCSGSRPFLRCARQAGRHRRGGYWPSAGFSAAWLPATRPRLAATAAPAEARILRSAVETTLQQAKRLGLVDKIDLSKVTGGSVTFSGLNYAETIKVTDDIAIVPLAGGTIKVTWDLDQTGLARHILRPLLQAGDDDTAGQDSLSIRAMATELNEKMSVNTMRPSFPGMPLPAVRVNGQWHLSLVASSAEFIERLASVEPYTALAMLAPDESQVIRPYLSTFPDMLPCQVDGRPL